MKRAAFEPPVSRPSATGVQCWRAPGGMQRPHWWWASHASLLEGLDGAGEGIRVETAIWKLFLQGRQETKSSSSALPKSPLYLS